MEDMSNPGAIPSAVPDSTSPPSIPPSVPSSPPISTPPPAPDLKIPVDKPRTFGSKTFYILVAAIVVLAAAAFFYFSRLGVPETPPPVSQIPKQTALDLLIESPTDETLVSESQVLVKGKTQPDAVVVFFTEVDQNSVESDSQGKFEGTVGLAEGINTLSITAFGENGAEKNTALNIVYDTESTESGETSP